MDYLVSVEEAKEAVREHSRLLPVEKKGLVEAAGNILATDIFSNISVPAYPQSSMDGYAMAYEPRRSYRLVGEMAAGSHKDFQLKPGEVVRIFTGAAVPAGANTVVMQEKARREEAILFVEDPNLVVGANVRPIGSEISAGELALKAGTLLTPAAIGFLSGIGVTEVDIYPPPAVSIIVTGNELQLPGEPLEYGQVYEANSFSILAALKSLGIKPMGIYRSRDNVEQLTEILLNALEESNVVLITGGVSVGDYDFTADAFDGCEVEKVFHKIRQKPGKPILFGVKDEKLVFGLPGNPSSVLTCYYQYVLPAFSRMCGQQLDLAVQEVPLKRDFNKPGGLTHFLKGIYDGVAVDLLQGQESYKLNSFAKANCLVQIPEDTIALKQGDFVKVHLFN